MKNLGTPVLLHSFIVLALLPGARLNAGEAVDTPKTPAALEAKEAQAAPAAKELTEDDKRAAGNQVKQLGSNRYSEREDAQVKLLALVFADKAKARAWDAWLGEARSAATDPEVIQRLPASVERLHRYAGRYRYFNPFLPPCEMEILVSGKIRIYMGEERRLISVGKISFLDEESVEFAGLVTPNTEKSDERGPATGCFVDGKLETDMVDRMSAYHDEWNPVKDPPALVPKEKATAKTAP
ncbi:MAG: hypothetical protein L6R28_21600 [Planctomycetes bacterium]|nr:hypothetical protein [Planctomycetota bacterium]